MAKNAGNPHLRLRVAGKNGQKCGEPLLPTKYQERKTAKSALGPGLQRGTKSRKPGKLT